MPPEIVVITIIALLAGTMMISFVARTYFKYLSEKAGGKRENSPSLTTSELEKMLRKVVTESNAPLLERIEGIEAHLAMEAGSLNSQPQAVKRLPSYKGDSILEDVDAPRDLAAISKKKSHTV